MKTSNITKGQEKCKSKLQWVLEAWLWVKRLKITVAAEHAEDRKPLYKVGGSVK